MGLTRRAAGLKGALLSYGRHDSSTNSTGNHALVVLANTSRSFAAIGAVLTILSLAIDPFVQEIIGLEDRQVSTPASFGTIAQAHRYSKGTEVDIEASGTAIVPFNASVLIIYSCCN